MPAFRASNQMQGAKAMNNTNHKKTGFDELDAALAAALGDASAWPAPRDGFEERCVACVEGILKGKKMRRPFWSLSVLVVRPGSVPEARGVPRGAAWCLRFCVLRACGFGSAGVGATPCVGILFHRRHRIPVRTHSEISGKERIARGGYEVLGEGVYGGRYMM